MLKSILAACLVMPAITMTALAPTAASAQSECSSDLQKAGTFTFNGSTAAFLVGYRWGQGVLTLENGQEFPFTARGWKGGETGVRDREVVGEVYGLSELEDFVGHYKGGAGAFVPGVASGSLQLANSECVVIVARHKSEGVLLSLPVNQKITIQFGDE